MTTLKVVPRHPSSVKLSMRLRFAVALIVALSFVSYPGASKAATPRVYTADTSPDQSVAKSHKKKKAKTSRHHPAKSGNSQKGERANKPSKTSPTPGGQEGTGSSTGSNLSK